MAAMVVSISGATGRIGRLITKLIMLRHVTKPNDWELGALLSSKLEDLQDIAAEFAIPDSVQLTTKVHAMMHKSNVIIDFSSPKISLAIARTLTKCLDKVIIIGTTNLDASTIDILQNASSNNKICHAPNTSIGMAIVHSAIKKLAYSFKDYDAEIQETHHGQKIDSPSGTAISLGNAIAQARNIKYDAIIYSGNAKRKCGQIGYAVTRGGNVVGEHTVNFFGENEIISVKHKALSRDLFAEGALYLAEMLYKKERNGFFSVAEIVNV